MEFGDGDQGSVKTSTQERFRHRGAKTCYIYHPVTSHGYGQSKGVVTLERVADWMLNQPCWRCKPLPQPVRHRNGHDPPIRNGDAYLCRSNNQDGG